MPTPAGIPGSLLCFWNGDKVGLDRDIQMNGPNDASGFVIFVV